MNALFKPSKYKVNYTDIMFCFFKQIKRFLKLENLVKRGIIETENSLQNISSYHESVLLYESNHAQVDKIDRIMERLGNLCSRLSKETKTTTAICNSDKPA